MSSISDNLGTNSNLPLQSASIMKNKDRCKPPDPIIPSPIKTEPIVIPKIYDSCRAQD